MACTTDAQADAIGVVTTHTAEEIHRRAILAVARLEAAQDAKVKFIPRKKK